MIPINEYWLTTWQVDCGRWDLYETIPIAMHPADYLLALDKTSRSKRVLIYSTPITKPHYDALSEK